MQKPAIPSMIFIPFTPDMHHKHILPLIIMHLQGQVCNRDASQAEVTGTILFCRITSDLQRQMPFRIVFLYFFYLIQLHFNKIKQFLFYLSH